MRIRRRNLRTIAYLSVAVTLAFGGCMRGVHSRRFVKHIDFTSYVGAGTKLFQSPSGTYYFPTLLVFNGDGQLVYRGNAEKQDNEVLRSLPDGFRKLRPLEPEVHIADVYQNCRELRDLPIRPLAQGRTIILSIGMEKCESCEVEGAAIEQAMMRLKDMPVDLVELIVNPPHG